MSGFAQQIAKEQLDHLTATMSDSAKKYTEVQIDRLAATVSGPSHQVTGGQIDHLAVTVSSPTQTLTEEQIDRLVATATKDATHRRMEIPDIAREAGVDAPLPVIMAAFESRGFGRYPETKVTREELELIKAGKHWSQTEEGKAWAKANSEVRDASGKIIKAAGTGAPTHLNG